MRSMSVCTGERVVTERSDQVQPPRRSAHISHVTLTRLAALSSHKQSAVCILVQLQWEARVMSMSVCKGERVITELSGHARSPRRSAGTRHVTLHGLGSLTSSMPSAVSILAHMQRAGAHRVQE